MRECCAGKKMGDDEFARNASNEHNLQVQDLCLGDRSLEETALAMLIIV